MRSQAERDEQTLRIATAVLGATAAWVVLVAVVAAGIAIFGELDSNFEALGPYVAAAYAITVIALLAATRRRTR